MLDIYASLMTQVTRLNEIREQTRLKLQDESNREGEGEGEDKVEGGEEKVDQSNLVEENRVDTILNDVFQVRPSFSSLSQHARATMADRMRVDSCAATEFILFENWEITRKSSDILSIRYHEATPNSP